MSSSTEEQEVLPAVFEHACTVYQKMESEAVLESREGDGIHGAGDQQLVWEGHLTKLFAELHFSVPYYTTVMRELKRMSCVRQKRRGGGNAKSQWILMRQPTDELFRSDDNRTANTVAKRKDRLAQLEQRVADMAKDVNRIRDDYGMIVEILQERESTNA